MYLRDAAKLREKVEVDLDLGLVLKVLSASVLVGAVIFYLGITFGQGSALSVGVSSSQSARVDRVLRDAKASSTSQAAAETTKPHLIFPSLLPKRRDRSVTRDELMVSLSQVLPENLDDQEQELKQFRKEILRDKHHLEYDPISGTVRKLLPSEIALRRQPVGVPQGPAPVRLGAPQPEVAQVAGEQVVAVAAQAPAKAPPSVQKRPKLGKYTIQLQSFKSRNEAEIFLNVMKARGYHPFIEVARIKGRGKWHRVRMGRFMDMKAAQRFKKRFEDDQGISTRVMGL